MSITSLNLPYDPKKLQRELKKYYISLTDDEISEMLQTLSMKETKELFSHIPENVMFKSTPFICDEFSYEEIISHLKILESKNNIYSSFIGDGLKNYKVHEIVPFVSNIRGLTTAYTPYQPERSQGSLHSMMLYSSALSKLTGFEAVNTSLYDRSTCLFEALNSAIKIKRKTDTVLVCESIYPEDINVLKTLSKETSLNFETVPVDSNTGLTDIGQLKNQIKKIGDKLAAVAFPQINSLGCLEDVHQITNLCFENTILSIAIIDPATLATGGLVPPVEYGDHGGTDMFVAEGQHLAIGPNFGGPGLGIFGIRFNSEKKNQIRSTPGRYVGKGKDETGKDALTMVLSTREQHIRREKASSNICSNEAFIATLAGASILAKGEKGMSESCKKSRESALKAYELLISYKEINAAFRDTPFFNEFTIKTDMSSSELIELGRSSKIHIGVDVSNRTKNNENLTLLSFSDVQNDEDFLKLETFLNENFTKGNECKNESEIPERYFRKKSVGLPNFSLSELKTFYTDLGEQNVSPDETIYPLGSCTMKYNPYINDYVASFKGFTDLHPETPEKDCQGSLEILFNIQEMFKSITGLDALTTQPVAGAQGELAGIKMFQAYHRDNGEGETRNIILIPRSAHGTNPATSTMAGFETKVVDGEKRGIIQIEADEHGQIDFPQLKSVVEKYNKRISGIMVTNPNTSGIFETKFKEMSDLIHSVGGLVYMDGANMNAIAGRVDIKALGVDAIHNNLHKTWSISHGGGGPGDAIVAVSEKLVDYLPGIQVEKRDGIFKTVIPPKSIGSFHRHLGNFAHKIRCYAYLLALGTEGVKKMSAVAVLSARYLFEKLKDDFPTLPNGSKDIPRMHEFILTLKEESFSKIQESGTKKADTIMKVGKLFLDFGLHAPTVAFPEIYGLMIEPTESYSKSELDHFCDVIKQIKILISENPEVLKSTPHFTPVRKVDEVEANKNLILTDQLTKLPVVFKNKISPRELSSMNLVKTCELIINESNK